MMPRNKSKQISSGNLGASPVSIVLIVISLILFTASLIVLRASKPTVYEYGVYKPETPIAAGDATVVIHSIRYSNGENGFVVPAGKQYLILDTTFQNNSNHPISITPSTQTYIKDSEGYVTYLTPFALENPLRAGDLLAGDKISGQLSYLVPNNKTYTMYIDAIWSGGVVSVRLNEAF